MRRQGILADSEIAPALARNKMGGLFSLADAAASRYAKRITSSAPLFDPTQLAERLGGDTLSLEAIPTLARGGNQAGLYSASELKQVISGMVAPASQLPTYWWSSLQENRLTPAQRLFFSEEMLTPEFHAYGDNDVAMTFHRWEPAVFLITVPGGDAAKDVLVRDTLLTLLDSLSYLEGFISPYDCLCHTGIIEDLEACQELMGESFTAEGLRERFEVGAGIAADTSEDDYESAMVEQLEDFMSFCVMSCMGDWMELMATLSSPRHWLLQNRVYPLIPHSNAPLPAHQAANAQALYEHNASRVEVLRQQFAEDFPETLAVADDMLASLRDYAEKPPVNSMLANNDPMMDYSMLEQGTQAWLTVSGGDQANAINDIFHSLMPQMIDDAMNSGEEYGASLAIYRDDAGEDAERAVRYCKMIGNSYAHLMAVAEATEKEMSYML